MGGSGFRPLRPPGDCLTHETESELLHKGACDFCGSSDARAVYDDGHSYCFACPEDTAWQADKDFKGERPSPQKLPADLLHGDFVALGKRGLTLKTAKQFGYQVGKEGRESVQIAPYRDANGSIVAQKVRPRNKDAMHWRGNKKASLPLFGQHLWKPTRQIVVTEGELDAMSVAQAMGNNWPAVSVPDGAHSAHKAIAQAASWLEQFERVVFMFDMDDPGREAAVECARLLTPGKAHIAELPLKDASEMLQAGRAKELVNLAWGARPYRPDGIIRVHEVINDLGPTGYGYPWPFRGLTDATYGIRRGELYGWGAGVGVGKTTVFKQLIAATIAPRLIADHSGLILPADALEPRKAGTLLLEENARRKTINTLGGMLLGKRVHVPGVEFDKDELRRILMEEMDPYLFLYDHFGAKDWEGVKDVIRHMVLGEGITDVFLDNLTALLAFADDDRKALDVIMADLASMVEQHNFTLHYVSHLTTPEGKAHEEGGRVLEKQFTGGRSIARWSHNLFALERNKQDPDAPTTLRILKERETGDATGVTIGLAYDRETGLFNETDLENEHGFKNEAGGATGDY